MHEDVRDDMEDDEQITLPEAHRYIIPTPEVAAMVIFAYECISEGNIEVYRNNRTGGLLLSYACQTCAIHHPIIDLEVLDEDPDILQDSQFLIPLLGSIPFKAFLHASEGEVQLPSEPYVYSAELIEKLAGTRLREPDTEPEDVFEFFPTAVNTIMEGECSYALDIDSGRTVLSYKCGECEAQHPLFSVASPAMQDARDAEGYTFIGNPFLDLLLEETGERRH
jgi:hypothetical protein